MCQPRTAPTISVATWHFGRTLSVVQSVETILTPELSPALTLITSLDQAAVRVTKKMYGTYVTPLNSPVQPERFSGYHTGVDFEILPDEVNMDVIVRAMCPGPLIAKHWASGYGGVAIQQCMIEGQTVTVLYGHVRLASVTLPLHHILQPHDEIGVLGDAYSTETDGERKHLHLSIHQGTTIAWAGYTTVKLL